MKTANPAYNKTFLVKDDNNKFPYIYDSAPKEICLSPNERKFYIIGKNENYLWQLVFDNEA